MNISSKVINIMDQITTDFALLIDLGPLQFSANSSYTSLEALSHVTINLAQNFVCWGTP